jgi:CRP/FNR family transcriptional regulator, cyclic AMP receptor protein
MNPLKLYFKITVDNNCPLYEKGELLTLSEKALTCPENKPTCLILVREMTNLLFEHLDNGNSESNENVYNCSGCTGLIKFVKISMEKANEEGLIAAPSSPLDSADKVLLKEIQNYPLIKAIPETEIAAAVRCFRKEKVEAGATLISKGQSSLYLYLILSGELVVSDNSLAIANLKAGDICGEMSYLGKDVAGADVRTITETEVLSIAGDAFCRLIDRIPDLQLFMAKVLVQRLSVSNSHRSEIFDACMSGWIHEMPPAELFQIFHMNQKTGILSLELPNGNARVSFREGCVINAQYNDVTNQAAIFDMLKEKEGRYTFTTGLSPEEMKAAEIGDFMMLLMEGIKRVDEAHED